MMNAWVILLHFWPKEIHQNEVILKDQGKINLSKNRTDIVGIKKITMGSSWKENALKLETQSTENIL